MNGKVYSLWQGYQDVTRTFTLKRWVLHKLPVYTYAKGICICMCTYMYVCIYIHICVYEYVCVSENWLVEGLWLANMVDYGEHALTPAGNMYMTIFVIAKQRYVMIFLPQKARCFWGTLGQGHRPGWNYAHEEMGGTSAPVPQGQAVPRSHQFRIVFFPSLQVLGLRGLLATKRLSVGSKDREMGCLSQDAGRLLDNTNLCSVKAQIHGSCASLLDKLGFFYGLLW